MNKYRNVRHGGYASKKEANRGAELVLLEKLKLISDLKTQVKFVVIPKQDGEREAAYIADFTYLQDGGLVVEDTKGFRTREYILKRKLMKLVNGITILEI